MSAKAPVSKITESKNNAAPARGIQVTAPPHQTATGHLLNLQRFYGNRGVQRMFESGELQAKLKIGQPGNRYEREADSVADRVMRPEGSALGVNMPGPTLGAPAKRTWGGEKLAVQRQIPASGPTIQRFINLATTKNLSAALYGGTDVKKFYKTIAGNHANLEGLISGKGKVYDWTGKKYRVKLVNDILESLLNSSTIFYYADDSEVFDEVYKRAVSSLYMRTSQGTGKIQKVKYPGTVGPKTNKKASVYWKVTTTGTYKFELNSTGLNNAYEALRTILFEGTSNKDTTRMHCDYVVAAIHFMAMAEDMGTAVFDAAVKKGDIKVWLQAPKSFDATVPESMATTGSYTTPAVFDPKKKSIGDVKIAGESDIIIGDHLVFYNHSAYNAMNKTQGESWRLENAFVTDKAASGGNFRFQGHGYTSPKSMSKFITAMRKKFNTLYNRAKAFVTGGKTVELTTKFPFVKLKTGVASSTKTSEHEIIYSKSGKDKDSWSGWSAIPSADRLTMPLREVTDSDYPNPFVDWGENKEKGAKGTTPFWVTRPVEGFKD